MFIDVAVDAVSVTAGWERAPRQLMDTIAKYPVALIGDVVQRMGMMASAIHHVTGTPLFHGSVLPLLTREGDNLTIHRALDEAQPGDVLVINGNGDTNRAVFGDLLGEICLARRVAAVVIDGAVRDVDELGAMGLPVYARAISPAGPSKFGPGQVGSAVACGNVVCYPGDAIFGDRDGIIVLRPNTLPALIEKLKIQSAFESALRKRIRSTSPISR